MSSTKETIDTCKELKRERSTFQKLNYPARACVIISIIVPLVLLSLTSQHDAKGNPNFDTSPYRIHAGIIFLVFVGLAVFLSRKAGPHKVSQTDEWAISAYDVYCDIVEFRNNISLSDEKQRAYDRFATLIGGISDKFDSLDEIIKWIPQVNQIQKLLDSTEQNILPTLESENVSQLPELETYLIRFIEYLLEPKDHLLNELLQIQITSTLDIEEKPSKLSILKNKPVKKIVMFLSILLAIAISTYMVATSLGIEKNYAFGGSIALLVGLGAMFRHYIEK
ncbi:MAG: hypothetical protein KGL95_07455 [Patescibacteria group bacterium]|nr:hypothetical protein [Patescibacteria group bacterium]